MDAPALPAWHAPDIAIDAEMWPAGEVATAVAESFNHPAPLDLRVNIVKAKREAVQAALAAAGPGRLADRNPRSQVLQRPVETKIAQVLHWALAGHRLYLALELPVADLHFGGHAANVEVRVCVVFLDDADQAFN